MSISKLRDQEKKDKKSPWENFKNLFTKKN